MENDQLQETPLAEEHHKLGARMVPFAGWNMPVQYPPGILAEHQHTREKVSLFDICHMGEFRVCGPGSGIALDSILARGVADQPTGTCRYNFLLTTNGTVIDDLIVYRLEEEEFFIVVNAGTRAGDATHFQEHLPTGIDFVDESADTAKLDLQGPGSVEILEKLNFSTEKLPGYFHWVKTEVASIPCLLSRTGYTGELGFEFYFAANQATDFWNLLLENDQVEPAGLGARDTLRLEMGYPLYGHELNLETTPVEAGFGPMLKLESSERSFIGSNVLKNSSPQKKLVGIELEGRRAAREKAVIRTGESQVGIVTSGTFSPSLEKAIAMAYLDVDCGLQVGAEVELEAGRTTLPGVITELPFYNQGSARKKL